MSYGTSTPCCSTKRAAAWAAMMTRGQPVENGPTGAAARVASSCRSPSMAKDAGAGPAARSTAPCANRIGWDEDRRCSFCGSPMEGPIHSALSWLATMTPNLDTLSRTLLFLREGERVLQSTASPLISEEEVNLLASLHASVRASRSLLATRPTPSLASMSKPSPYSAAASTVSGGEVDTVSAEVAGDGHGGWNPVPVGNPVTCCCQAVDLILTSKRLGSEESPSGALGAWVVEVTVIAKTRIEGDPNGTMTGPCTLKWEEYHENFAQTDDKGNVVPGDQWVTLSDAAKFTFGLLSPITDFLAKMTCSAGEGTSPPVVDDPRLVSGTAANPGGGTAAIWGIVTLKSGCDATEIRRYFYVQNTDGSLTLYPPPPNDKPDDEGTDTSPKDKPPFPPPDPAKPRKKPEVPKSAKDATKPPKPLPKDSPYRKWPAK